MSSDLLRRAAQAMREDAERESTLRDGDPYWTTEASVFERRMTPSVALAVADLLDWFADTAATTWHATDEADLPVPHLKALAVARAYLGESGAEG